MTMKNLSFFILAIALLCCTGCSAMRVAYNNADLYLRYRITGYTSFNAEQKNEIRRKIADYLHWHRKNALPEYIAVLQDADRLIQRPGPLKVEEVSRLRGEYNRLYGRTVDPVIRPAARMLSALDSNQIKELGKTFTKKNRKQKDELLYGSDPKNLVMRAERNIDLVEKLVGSLSRNQEEKIRKMSMAAPFVAKYYIEFREGRQAGLIALLNSKAGEEKIAAFLRSWIITPEATRTPEQQLAIQSYENAMDEMTARIYDLLTDSQKSRLHKQIQTYIEDFQYLSAEKITAITGPALGCAVC